MIMTPVASSARFVVPTLCAKGVGEPCAHDAERDAQAGRDAEEGNREQEQERRTQQRRDEIAGCAGAVARLLRLVPRHEGTLLANPARAAHSLRD